MVEHSQASVESDKEVSETKTEEEKPLLMEYKDTSKSTRVMLCNKIDETECLVYSGKGKLGTCLDFFLKEECTIV